MDILEPCMHILWYARCINYGYSRASNVSTSFYIYGTFFLRFGKHRNPFVSFRCCDGAIKCTSLDLMAHRRSHSCTWSVWWIECAIGNGSRKNTWRCQQQRQLGDRPKNLLFDAALCRRLPLKAIGFAIQYCNLSYVAMPHIIIKCVSVCKSCVSVCWWHRAISPMTCFSV